MNKDGSPLRAGGDSAHRLPPPLQVLRLILWATSKMLSSACHYTGQGKVAAPTQGPTSARALFPIHPFIIKYSSSTLCPRGCTPITFFKECKYLKKSVFFFLWISAMPSWALWRELLREPHRWKPQQLRARAWRAAFRSFSLLWPLMNV